jgi:ISXO2-like transposase domain/Transposase zinc-ribbon domain
MNIREAHEKFATDEQCLQYIEKMRWPDGIVRCPTCGDKNVEKYDRPITLTRKRRSKKRDPEKENKRGWFYICRNADCREQFSPTAGTIFHDTHLPLIVWFQAIALILNAKKGISAKQLQRDLGIGGYKTAWYLNHRIREVMGDDNIPKHGGIVEIDETYIGGKSESAKKWDSKDCVVGLRERKGGLRLVHVERGRMTPVMEAIRTHLSPDVKWIVTDESKIYQFKNTEYKDAQHLRINHKSGQYVRGNVYTNTIESAFSLLKRGIIGSFHQISIKHLQRYLNEFSYRFNRRNDNGVYAETVRRLCGFKPLTFASLTSEPEAEPF